MPIHLLPKSFSPKTLLGQTILILVLIVIGTQIASQWVFQRYVIDEFGSQLVRIGSNNLLSMYQALRLMSPAERKIYADDIAKRSIYKLTPASEATLPPSASKELSPRLALIEERLKKEISPEAAIYIEKDLNPQKTWIYLPLEGGAWWIQGQRFQFDRNFPYTAAILILSSVLLAVFLAWRLVKRVNQPLAAVQKQILNLAAGQTLIPIQPSNGPKEVNDLALAVNKMAGHLKQAETDRTLLLAGISHDLRTPLSRLRLGVEMMGVDHPAELQQLALDIEEMDRIISQFLDFARAPEPVHLETHDLSELAHQVAEGARVQHRPVICTIQNDLRIRMNPIQVRRIINNLLENAWRYGGTPIELQIYRDGDQVVLAVLDRGPGIPEDQIARLMQPFTRLDPSRNGSTGAGLGLAIVNRLAQSHHAKFALSEREGGGLVAKVSFIALG